MYSLIVLKRLPDTWICKLGVLARNHTGKKKIMEPSVVTYPFGFLVERVVLRYS